MREFTLRGGSDQSIFPGSGYKGKALTGEFKGLYRWRTGNIRVIYEIQNKQLIVLVLKIGQRQDVYR